MTLTQKTHAALDARVKTTLDSMTVEDKVGQVFMFGFPGKDPERARPLIEDLKAGGIIYFSRNTGPLSAVAELSRSLQDMAMRSGPGIPLFISTDQEGGMVCRLTQDFPLMPGHMALAAAGGPDLAEQVAGAIGTGLRAAGVNVDLAPVLDVNDNPRNPVIGVRSFGSDPERVAELGAAFARGLSESGVMPVGKHFPGHGNTSVDSHVDVPVLLSSRDRLEEVELLPFRKAFGEGLEAVMSAHILFKALDAGRPATLSRHVLHGLLRDEMGFSGLVMTDCLEMNAIARSPGTVRGAVGAFIAGADMLLISHTFDLQKRAYEALCHAVRSGEVSASRLDESVSRILHLKFLFGIPSPLDPGDFPKDGWAEYRNLSRTAHRNSITVVKDLRKVLPLRAGARVLVVAPDGVHSLRVEDEGGEGPGPVTTLGHALRRRGFMVRDVTHSTFEGGQAEDADYVVLVTHGATADSAQSEFLGKVRSMRSESGAPGNIVAGEKGVVPVILVAVREPYDLSLFPEVETYICTYGPRPESMEALGDVLAGAVFPAGRLPVELGT